MRLLLTGRAFVAAGALGLGSTLVGLAAEARDDTSGESIYREKCASCHGLRGEGAKGYEKPLVGDRSIGQLSRLIAETMPEDDPGSCVGPDAAAVARYIHEGFYSVTAQERNKPPRVVLARLTVRQLRNTVADLIGSFRGRTGRWDSGGLTGHYYRSRELWKEKDLVIDRVDPQVDFDFGTEAPGPDRFDKSQFSILWRGSVLAPETGDYEFIVRTDQGVRLYVNDQKIPLIDASVKSGNDLDQRGSIYLLGGHPYPIRLEFSKAKQGVDDSKDKPAPEKHAGVLLLWKIGTQAEAVIPPQALSTVGVEEAFVLQTPFPPDDRSVGYERGTTVSKAWEAATTEAAIEVTLYVATHLKALAKTEAGNPDFQPKLMAFCEQFAERAFRRPLSDEVREIYVRRPFASSPDPESALRRSILMTLKSPRFLYQDLGDPDDFSRASKMAYALWDSPPDESLLQSAVSGQFHKREHMGWQVDRMLRDVRAHAKIRDFLMQWLKLEKPVDIAKPSADFAGFDARVVADLRASLDRFLDDVVWSDASDFRELLLSENVYLNGRLARFYGYPLADDAPFQKIKDEAQGRSGVLTHPYLMANFAYSATSSPIHRGVFVMRSVLGRSLKPPPEAVAPLAPDLHPDLSTRQRVETQTSPRSCTTCHSMINPLGFALENYDAVGRFRLEEKGKPVDATGTYEPPLGDPRNFSSARDLAKIIVENPESHAAFVNQLFHHMVKQPIRAYGADMPDRLRVKFAENRFHIQKLMADIAIESTLTPPVVPPSWSSSPAQVGQNHPKTVDEGKSP